ncbi:MAG: DUF1801 domain-containing protein [Flavobacteriaceae bacterium]|nr:DUF1801 domain-containing protein [Flavobacteriaceae bacterium]
MNNLQVTTNPEVELVFKNYPKLAREKISMLRELILEAAEELEEIATLEETLKWGEPSYLAKKGSTIRIDWKEKSPDQYAMYFQCTSRLIPTFKFLYSQTFTFDGSRAIIFQMEDKIPKEALKNCIKAALTYHKIKHLPTLGI